MPKVGKVKYYFLRYIFQFSPSAPKGVTNMCYMSQTWYLFTVIVNVGINFLGRTLGVEGLGPTFLSLSCLLLLTNRCIGPFYETWVGVRTVYVCKGSKDG